MAFKRVWSKFKWFLHHLLLLLGAVYFAINVYSFLDGVCPDTLDWIATASRSPPTGPWPAHRSSVFPIACHSHNDYWRSTPLFTALKNGCTSVEADVWLAADEELLVGHVERALSPERTLSTLYLDPLLEILDQANPQAGEVDRYHHEDPSQRPRLSGVFDTAPEESLIFLIDFKSNGSTLWPLVYSQLDPFRKKGYLSYFNGTSVVQGPITVVASGNAPFECVIENKYYRDIFFDGPLDLMSSVPVRRAAEYFSEEENVSTESAVADLSDPATDNVNMTDPLTYNPTNSFYASISFVSSIGFPTHSRLTRQQLALLRAQIRGAHAQGLRVRYWGVPGWPIGLRNYLWRVMVREGVDFLSVDDVRAVAKDNWGPRKGGWGGSGGGKLGRRPLLSLRQNA